MAVLNSILRGQLKGRIGNQWFAHARDAKGRPVTRTGTINSTPTNPRSSSQQQQRAMFANAVKFYQRAQSNFFKFAFEDKKKNESDYNAFMRHNIANSLIIDKTKVQNSNFPALGNKWQLSQGSLTNYLMVNNTDLWPENNRFQLAIQGGNVKELSSVLLDDFGVPLGTIITMVVVATGLTLAKIQNDSPSLIQPIWMTLQFITDLKDTTEIGLLPRRGQNLLIDTDGTSPTTSFYLFDNYPSAWVGLIMTRKRPGGLYCTTSYLEPNENAQALVDYFNDIDRVSDALTSWQKQEESILEGSVSNATTRVTSINGNDIPWNAGDVVEGSNANLKILGKNMDEIETSDFTITNGTINGILNLAKEDGILLNVTYGTTNGNGTLECEGVEIMTWNVKNGTDSSSSSSSGDSSSSGSGDDSQHATS